MFDGFISPSTLIRREILEAAAREAVLYGTTVREVVDAFFSGHPRPGLASMLDAAYAAAGIPPHETMELVGRFFDVEQIEPEDLLVVLGAYRARMPLPAQAKELVEGAQRLARRARIHAKQIRAAQAVYDASRAETDQMPPQQVLQAARPAIRAQVVQRYAGLRTQAAGR